MVLVYAIRVLLALVLLLDIPKLMKILENFIRGGTLGVEGWVAHAALENRWMDSTPAERAAWVRQAYFTFSVMLFVMPPALYFLQRWMASKLKRMGTSA
jgi:hypothetical protein